MINIFSTGVPASLLPNILRPGAPCKPDLRRPHNECCGVIPEIRIRNVGSEEAAATSGEYLEVVV